MTGEHNGGALQRAEADADRTITVAAWNINGLRARAGRVEAWTRRHQPDVLLLNETRADRGDPSEAALLVGDRHVHHHGLPGGRDGVAITSTTPLKDVVDGFDPDITEDLRTRAAVEGWEPAWCDEARLTSAEVLGLRVASIYVPNGRTLDHPHYHYKLAWLEALREQATRWATAGPVLVGGDFNVAPADVDCWNPRGFRGRTHTSPAERERIAALTTAGGGALVDLWRAVHGDEAVGFTWWNYRILGFQKGQGLRIDMLMATPDLVAGATCEVDLQERAAEGPSDHAPVVAVLRRSS